MYPLDEDIAREVAYHEAGHAVVGPVLGIPFTSVIMGAVVEEETIAPPKDIEGALRRLDMVVGGNVADSIRTGSSVKLLSGNWPAAISWRHITP